MNSFYILAMMFVASSTIMIPNIYAEDENESDEEGNGLMQSEQEREQGDEGGIPLGSNTGNIILYGTIAAIVASIGYTAFKIISSKRKSNTVSK